MLRVLIDHHRPEKVFLFGSLASGRVREMSDLDLVVVKRTDERFLDRIARVLNLLEPKVGVDVLVYTPEEFERMRSERPFFRDEVLRQGKLLYENGG